MNVPTLTHFAGGARLAAHTARTAPVFDPATGEVTAQVPLADATDIRRVIDDAASAAPAWGQRSAVDRAHVLFRFRELLLAQSSDWAFIMKTGTAVSYAESRVKTHLQRFGRLATDLESGTLDEAFVAECESRDNLFPSLDPKLF